jgi:ElaA protein
VRIGAQQRLEGFYQSLGFVTDSEPYDEDGIPHVEMLRAGKTP